MDKQIVNPSALVKPSGYSHGMITHGGKLLFLAGQLGNSPEGPVDPASDLPGQFQQALSNLRTVVEEAGGSVADIVKLTIFVTDLNAYRGNLKPIGAAYRSVLGDHFPAMTLVEVKSLFDAHGMVEIEGMAVLPD